MNVTEKDPVQQKRSKDEEKSRVDKGDNEPNDSTEKNDIKGNKDPGPDNSNFNETENDTENDQKIEEENNEKHNPASEVEIQNSDSPNSNKNQTDGSSSNNTDDNNNEQQK